MKSSRYLKLKNRFFGKHGVARKQLLRSKFAIKDKSVISYGVILEKKGVKLSKFGILCKKVREPHAKGLNTSSEPS